MTAVRSGQLWANPTGNLAIVRVARSDKAALLYQGGSRDGERQTLPQADLLRDWRLHADREPCALCGNPNTEDCACCCDCETYEPCAGECCGRGNCTCTPGLGEVYDDEPIGVFPL